MGYLDVDWETIEKEQQISKDEILLGCLKHLNIVPEKKKNAKKEPKPKYGILEPYKADFKTKDGKSFIVVQFKTNERANPNFWCEGHSWDGERIIKKRGRKPKVQTEQNE